MATTGWTPSHHHHRHDSRRKTPSPELNGCVRSSVKWGVGFLRFDNNNDQRGNADDDHHRRIHDI